MIEVRFILDVVQVRQKLLSIRRQGADVVSLLLALPVFTEAIGKVNIPGALTELVLRMGRQPFNFILVGTFLLVGFGKLFKKPRCQAELNKIVPFGFSLQRQKMVYFLPSK